MKRKNKIKSTVNDLDNVLGTLLNSLVLILIQGFFVDFTL